MGKDKDDIDALLDELKEEGGKKGKPKDEKPAEPPPQKPPNPESVKIPVTGEVEIDRLKFNDDNRPVIEDDSFLELVESIRAKGLLIPVIVNKKHEVVDGHRRIAACKKIGHKTIPFIVRDKDYDEATIIANYIRLNLTAEQVGEILERKKAKEEKTQEELAKEIGLSQSRISQIIGKRRKAKKPKGPSPKKQVKRVSLPAGVRVSVSKTKVEVTFTLDDEMLKHPEKAIVQLFREVKGFAELIESHRK